MLGIKHAVPVMREEGGGAIVTTSSVAGVMANVGPVLYSIAKAAIVQMSQVAAVRLAHENIRVNCVNPGVIPTPIFGRAFGLDAEESAALEPKVREMAKTFQPLPRAGDVSDIAEAVLYLAADSGRFVTGETLIVDGGLVRGPAPDPEGGVFKAFADALDLDIAKARKVK
jgi:NAD(P)-dependent dehydrogenase (short-subunit alcohol dehydrogenase family)